MAEFLGQAVVTIACGTNEAIVHYTTDGTNPSASVGLEYSAPFTLYNNATVKAIGTKAGIQDSDIATSEISVKLPAGDLVKYSANSAGDIGTFGFNRSAFNTEYAKYDIDTLTVRYTLDGTEPTAESPEMPVATGVMATSECTLKYKIFGTKNVASDSKAVTAGILKVQTPVITVA